MIRFLLRRAGFTLLLLAGITVITFVLSHVLPGDPARLIAGPRASAAVVAEIRHLHGFDRPLAVQFFQYVDLLLRGDLGQSLVTHHPVTQDIAACFPATLELVLVASVFGGVAGVAIGAWSAVHRGGGGDMAGRALTVFGLSMPDFWLAILSQLLFFSTLAWLPYGGRLDIGTAPPMALTGLYSVDALLRGQFGLFWQAMRHLLLPACVLMFPVMGMMIRVVRASMLDVLTQDHVRTARAKGLRPLRLYFHHVLRNALLPAVTVFGLELGLLLSGDVLVELIFDWPGIGRYTANAIESSDYNAIMGVTVVISIVYVLINLAVDIIYTLLDPRVKLT